MYGTTIVYGRKGDICINAYIKHVAMKTAFHERNR